MELWKRYKITLEQWWNKFMEQDCCCAICKRHYSVFKMLLSVDHCHKTGKVRGLLCGSCNYTLAGLEVVPNIIESYKTYLDKYA